MRALLAVALLAVAAAAGTYDPATSMDAWWLDKVAVCGPSDVAAWTCSSCGHFPQFHVQGVHANASLKSFAFTGYDAATQTIWLTFRGTENIRNWITNFDVTLIDYPQANAFPTPGIGAKVHKGFHAEWESYGSAVMADLMAMRAKYGASARIVTNGHSMGGAVANLAAMHVLATLYVSNPKAANVHIYTYGTPRLGNPAFAAWAATSVLPDGKQFRVTHEQDPIPHVPFVKWDYQHIEHELWFNNDLSTGWTNCSDNATAEDPHCSDRYSFADTLFHISDHFTYLGVASSCSATGTVADAIRDASGPADAATGVAQPPLSLQGMQAAMRARFLQRP